MERSGIRVADTFEQVRGESTIDYRADLFALGAILYEMLSGRRAFQAGSAVETMNATSGFTCFRASRIDGLRLLARGAPSERVNKMRIPDFAGWPPIRFSVPNGALRQEPVNRWSAGSLTESWRQVE